jgi:uncharacterized protein (TIGR02145 family)
MAENLKVTKYRNGDNITNITTNSDWTSDTSGAYGVYDNDATTYLDSYGLLYNWYAVDNSSGRYICPEGWHVPTKDEYDDLSEELGGDSVAGGKMKVTGTDHWYSQNTGATNESGFTARGSGFRLTNGTYYYLKQYFYAWTVTLDSNNSITHSYYNRLKNNSSAVLISVATKNYGYSVRCLED